MRIKHLEIECIQLQQPLDVHSRGMGWYNGYNPAERNEKFREMKRKIVIGELSPPSGPCALCGDPDSDVEYHDEDYGIPYQWSEPSAYVLCRHCHRQKLHTRYSRPVVWQAYLAHVRRGGYARDLEDPLIKREFVSCCNALKHGQAFLLRNLRPYTRNIGEEWFASLRLNRESERSIQLTRDRDANYLPETTMDN